MGVGLRNKGVDIDAAVDKPPGDRRNGAVGLFFIPDNAGYVGDAGQHTGAVRVAQPPLDPQTVGFFGVKVRIVRQVFTAEQLDFLRLQGRHIRIIHYVPLPVQSIRRRAARTAFGIILSDQAGFVNPFP